MIDMQNITKYYGNFRAVNELNLHVDKGEILGLLGPNGAGKTTAMRILTTFIPATSGKVKVAGFDIDTDAIEVKRRLGYLPETPPVYPEMTVESYLQFVSQIKEIPYKRMWERINYVVDRIGLEEYRNRIISTLSKGYRQRVGLAQALIHNPDVLVLDEPTVGLDPMQIIEIRNLIKDLAQDHTIILSTHILPEVSMTCNRVVIINEGEIVAEDTVENLENKESGKPAWKISFVTKEGYPVRDNLEKIAGVEVDELNVGETLTDLKLHLENTDLIDAVTERIISDGCKIRELTPIRASLEEVFLKYTYGSERKENA